MDSLPGFRAAPWPSDWGRTAGAPGAWRGEKRRPGPRPPAAPGDRRGLEFPEAVGNELTLRRALAALVDRLLAREERGGRPVRKLALTARLVGGGSWRRTVTLREPSADRGVLRTALGPKLAELPPPSSPSGSSWSRWPSRGPQLALVRAGGRRAPGPSPGRPAPGACERGRGWGRDRRGGRAVVTDPGAAARCSSPVTREEGPRAPFWKRHPSSAYAVLATRRLNEPRAALVEETFDGTPRRVNRQPVAVLREEWRVARPLVDGGAGQPPLLRGRARERPEHRRLPRRGTGRMVHPAGPECELAAGPSGTVHRGDRGREARLLGVPEIQRPPAGAPRRPGEPSSATFTRSAAHRHARAAIRAHPEHWTFSSGVRVASAGSARRSPRGGMSRRHDDPLLERAGRARRDRRDERRSSASAAACSAGPGSLKTIASSEPTQPAPELPATFTHGIPIILDRSAPGCRATQVVADLVVAGRAPPLRPSSSRRRASRSGRRPGEARRSTPLRPSPHSRVPGEVTFRIGPARPHGSRTRAEAGRAASYVPAGESRSPSWSRSVSMPAST